uniref:Uncharacterized protein n=1 Tax=Arundo donax TaxID=35708 RepID=A0A0A8ZY59_ARUDO
MVSCKRIKVMPMNIQMMLQRGVIQIILNFHRAKN